jgi:GTP-binding protein HflX
LKRTHEILNPPRAERALLVGHAGRDHRHLEGSLDELERLADTAGASVLDRVVQRRGPIHPGTFVGKGKLEELRGRVEATDGDMVIFDDDLSPAQIRNLEKALQRKVVDRSELILDIFARRARTRESRLQVELAQLEYALPRLTGLWRHLERQAGGIGTRGPGETQLETDRRLVRERIAVLKRGLAAVERERQVQRRRRRGTFRAALVGYTNAGKSTLFNALTRAHVLVEDRLFATLDSTTRKLVSPALDVALITDTVGFIRKLPHHLVASFRSTLMEAVEADQLLHVVDASEPEFRRQMAAVEQVLDELLQEPRPTVLVFNKCDRLEPEAIAGLKVEYPGSFVISARQAQGLDVLRESLWEQAASRRKKAS